MNSFKKICAIVLSMAMMLCVISTTAFAAEPDADSGRITGMTMNEVIAYLESRKIARCNLSQRSVDYPIKCNNS